MASQVIRFELPVDNVVMMPVSAQVLTVTRHGGRVMLWVEAGTGWLVGPRKFLRVRGTEEGVAWSTLEYDRLNQELDYVGVYEEEDVTVLVFEVRSKHVRRAA